MSNSQNGVKNKQYSVSVSSVGVTSLQVKEEQPGWSELTERLQQLK